MVAGKIYQNTLLSTFNCTFLEGGETGLVGVGGESAVGAHTQCIHHVVKIERWKNPCFDGSGLG